MHSIFSDGTQWPEEMVIRAKYAGYDMIALTDHDTIQGVNRFMEACDKFSIKGVQGVECDCVATEFQFDKELLGYFPQKLGDNTINYLEKTRKNRMEKIHHYLNRAQQIFCDKSNAKQLTYENLVKFKLGFVNEKVLNLPFSWNKSNFYYFLQSQQIIDDSEFQATPENPDGYKAFKKIYFTKDKLGLDSEPAKATVQQIADTILKDKGYPVLPHYGHLFHDKISKLQKEKEKAEKFLKYCWDLGIWGVEMYYYKGNLAESDQINEYIQKICKDLQLPFHFTYGSDCHGRNHPSSNTLEFFSGEFEGFP
jgi:hypothetical protein